jgi:hypothetical protein
MSTKLAAILVLGAISVILPNRTWGFGEELGLTVGLDHHRTSTHHLHLTRALAACAGFSHTEEMDPLIGAQDAERIAIFDALADQETFSVSSALRYTICTAPPYPLPYGPHARGLNCDDATRNDLAMPLVTGQGITRLAAWKSGWNASDGCFTSRYGPYSSLFHFPTGAELKSLRAWAFGQAKRPVGRAQFVFGGFFSTVWDADCFAERIEEVETGAVREGSLEALGIYLHALADRFSHGVCIASWGERRSPPWPTHTVTTAQRGCSFLAHAEELGCPDAIGSRLIDGVVPAEVDFVRNSIEAARRVYEELVAFARTTGRTPKVASWDAHHGWLARQVERFVLSFGYLGGAGRRARFAHALTKACEGLAAPEDSCVADVETDDPPDHESCPFPLTPPCGSVDG